MKEFALEIVTPDRQVFAGEVTAVRVPGVSGAFQVLYKHAPLISTLGKGLIKVEKSDGEVSEYAIEDGVVEVLNNKVIVLVERLLETTA